MLLLPQWGEGAYDLIGNVVPDAGLPFNLPLALLVGHPLEIRIAGTLLAGDPAVLELSEMALEEADLVLVVGAGRVGVLAHDAKMIKDLAGGNGRLGLRDQLSAAHSLAVPEGCAVESELGALLRDCVVGVLEVCRQVDVLIYGP